MGFIINVSKADQNKDGTIKLDLNLKPSYAHYFATASRSIGHTSSKAKRIVTELSIIYPSPLYKIDVLIKDVVYEDIDVNTL